jgi:hypothetical protein
MASLCENAEKSRVRGHSARVSREGQKADRRGPCATGTVAKPAYQGGHQANREKTRVVGITRKMAHGLLEQAEKLLHLSSGGHVLNTAFIKRFNATFREWLANLTRKSRHATARLLTLQAGIYLGGLHLQFLPRPSRTLGRETDRFSLFSYLGGWTH